MENTKQRIQLFENPILEKLTRTNAKFVISSLIIFSIIIFIYSLKYRAIGVGFQFGLLVSGFLSFSLAEYLIHRYIFHSGDYKNSKSWQFKIHGIHHHSPSDKQRLAMPLPMALLLSYVFYLIFWFFMGKYALSFFPGFIIGYAFYLFVHYTIHTQKAPNNFTRLLWKNHFIHHYKNEDKAFGVTTPIWDIFFGTMP